MTLNIVITSRNKPSNVKRLLKSFSDTRQYADNIIIIDDSTKQEFSDELSNVANSYIDLNTVVVDKEAVEKLREDSELEETLKLGVPEWNLANGRNIGMLFSYAFADGNGQTMFLDDDMTFPYELNNDPPEGNIKLKQIGLQGCPDLSRLEWVQLYVKTRNPENASLSKYVEKLYQQTQDRSSLVISTYTDLILPQEGQLPSLLARDELSGGAYICSTNVLKLSSFPSWFDEDWFWFDRIRRITETRHGNAGITIQHNSDRKKILDNKWFEFEEEGKILTEVLKESYNTGKLVDVAVIRQMEYSLNKVRRIQKLVEQMNGRNEIDEEVQYHLQQLNDYLRQQTASRYVAKAKRFKEFNDTWTKEFQNTVDLIRYGAVEK